MSGRIECNSAHSARRFDTPARGPIMSAMKVGVLLWLLSVGGTVARAASQEGRSHAREDVVSIQTLPDSGAVQLGRRFPGRGISGLLQNELLRNLFPDDTFFEGHDYRGKPSSPNMIVLSSGQVLPMPEGYNLLLNKHGVTVTDTNIIELAEGLVSVAVGAGLINCRTDVRRPSHFDTTAGIVFLNVHRNPRRESISSPLVRWMHYDLMLEVRIDGQNEEWWFLVLHGQFDNALRRGPQGYINSYYPVIVESTPSGE